VQGLIRGVIVPAPQDPAEATRCRIIRKEDGRLDWSRPAGDLDRAIRALESVARDVRTLERKEGRPLELLIFEAEPAEHARGPQPASKRGLGWRPRRRTWRRRSRRGADLVVACRYRGPFLATRAAAGKKTLDAAELLRGYGIAEGDAFRPAVVG